jgi:uncharacterized protein (TIGR03790 family)
MLRRFPWLSTLGVCALACGEEDGGSSVASSAATGGQSVTCPLPERIDVSGDPLPGATLSLSVAAEDGDVQWSTESGMLSAPTGATVDWTLPAPVHLAEPAQVTALVTKAGCDARPLARDLVVDWPPALRTVVIANPMMAGSTDVAAHYAAFRAIPDDHQCEVPSADGTILPGTEYEAWLSTVMGCVDALGPHIHYLIPVYGVPYKVAGRIADIANSANIATVSLDALLVYGDDSLALTEALLNRYYQPGNSVTGVYEAYIPFGELRLDDALDYFMVARIDGADADAAKALVDRTEAADMLAARGMLSGTVYVDGNRGIPHPTTDEFGSYESGEWNIIGVEKVFTADGTYPVVADYQSAEFGTSPAPLTCPDALYYAGWYSFGNYNDVFTWNPGAIGGHLDSCSACDIRGMQDWSAQALRRGITATFGAVNEPYVAGMPEYDQFFKYLLDGASYGEAAYESTRVGAWMMVWVGDPLYRPYPSAR